MSGKRFFGLQLPAVFCRLTAVLRARSRRHLSLSLLACFLCLSPPSCVAYLARAVVSSLSLETVVSGSMARCVWLEPLYGSRGHRPCVI